MVKFYIEDYFISIVFLLKLIDFIFLNFFAEIKACDSSPCLNGGNCTDKAGGNFTCQCKTGWTGERCEGEGDLFCFILFLQRIFTHSSPSYFNLVVYFTHHALVYNVS